MCKHIERPIFGFFGVNSIIVYCLQIALLRPIEKAISMYLFTPNTWPNAILFYLLTMALLLPSYYVLIMIINTRYLQFVLGKF